MSGRRRYAGILSTFGGVTYAPVTPTSTFHVDLNGITPGDGYDQVQAGVQAGRPHHGAQLSISGTFYATNGTQFVIIASGLGHHGQLQVRRLTLTEGLTFDIGGNTKFKITYVGGLGHHDVILTRVFVIDIWTGASKTSNNWSDPMNWAKHTIPGAQGDLAGCSSRPRALRKFNINDLPVGFRVGEIDFTGGAFTTSAATAFCWVSGFENIGGPSLNVVSFDVTLTCNTVWNNTAAAFIDSGNINLMVPFRLVHQHREPPATTTTKLVRRLPAPVDLPRWVRER